MANLRTNNLSGEQGQNAYRGSVFFDGTGDKLSVPNSADVRVGSNDFTLEAWVRFGNPAGDWDTIIGMWDAANTRRTVTLQRHNNSGYLYLYVSPDGGIGNAKNANGGNLTVNHWHHVAGVRDGNTLRIYQNGVQVGTASFSGSALNNTTDALFIGNEKSSDSNNYNGYISNVRFVNGTCLYPDGTTFTPPTSELTLVPNTVLLACQDSNDPTQEETGKTITAAGNLSDATYVRQQPKVIPPYGVDAGNTFGGPIQQSSQGYMYFPSGRTEERGGTRACWFRGYGNSSDNRDEIDFTEMSSRGNAVHFGDALSSNRQAGALGSSTRGVFGGRDGSSNVIEFITFSTQSNSSDFGDFTVGRSGSPGTASDGTRGLFFGGYAPNLASANVIEFITIANLGNGTDFGDLTNAGSEAAGCASPTRAIRMGGRLTGNNPTDVIDFFTIQTLSNAQDFGDLTVGRSEAGGASSDTRGVCIAGYNYPGGGQNIIDFIEIASQGNATDFGDLAAYTDSWQGGSGSNNVIIAHGIGYNDSARDNRIDFITIATTGNSVDYGDLTVARSQIPCATNGHGGLS